MRQAPRRAPGSADGQVSTLPSTHLRLEEEPLVTSPDTWRSVNLRNCTACHSLPASAQALSCSLRQVPGTVGHRALRGRRTAYAGVNAKRGSEDPAVAARSRLGVLSYPVSWLGPGQPRLRKGYSGSVDLFKHSLQTETWDVSRFNFSVTEHRTELRRVCVCACVHTQYAQASVHAQNHTSKQHAWPRGASVCACTLTYICTFVPICGSVHNQSSNL